MATKTRKQPAQPTTKSSAKHSAIEWLKSLAVGFLIFIVLRTFVLQTFTIISGSMEDTLLVGDFLVVNKVAYGAVVPATQKRLPGYTNPKHGDIVVFTGRHENPPIDLVKRLIGLPGDTLAMRDGTLYRNGQPLSQPYAKRLRAGQDVTDPAMEWQRSFLTDSAVSMAYHPSRDNWGPIVVPADRFFMLGDNRDESLDSRYWGFVREHDLKGKAAVLYFSWNRLSAGLGKVRWSRIGDIIH